MKINFTNLFHLDRGEIELNKFNVIVGKNNTNKTTIAQIIDSMFSKDYSVSLLYNYFLKSNIVDNVSSQSYVKMDLIEILDEHMNKIFDYEAEHSQKIISNISGGPSNQHNFFMCKRSLCTDDNDNQFLTNCHNFLTTYTHNNTNVKKDENDSIITFFPTQDTSLFARYIVSILTQIYVQLPIFVKNIRFFPTGRETYIEYNSELKNLGKNKISNDFINFFENLTKNKTTLEKSFCYDLVCELEKLITGGELKFIEKNDRMAFILEENIKTQVCITEIENFSSSTKSIGLILYYLKYIVKENDFLIIDEPEISLHPASAKKFIELLLKIAITGKIKILIITHNDILLDVIKIFMMKEQSFSSNISMYTIKNDNSCQILSSVQKENNVFKVEEFEKVKQELNQEGYKAYLEYEQSFSGN